MGCSQACTPGPEGFQYRRVVELPAPAGRKVRWMCAGANYVTDLWVNPDCGLKTRGWSEIEAQLGDMVAAAREMRNGG